VAFVDTRSTPAPKRARLAVAARTSIRDDGNDDGNDDKNDCDDKDATSMLLSSPNEAPAVAVHIASADDDVDMDRAQDDCLHDADKDDIHEHIVNDPWPLALQQLRAVERDTAARNAERALTVAVTLQPYSFMLRDDDYVFGLPQGHRGKAWVQDSKERFHQGLREITVQVRKSLLVGTPLDCIGTASTPTYSPATCPLLTGAGRSYKCPQSARCWRILLAR
jgi:hypothetical protein